jgi:hypothetical protein
LSNLQHKKWSVADVPLTDFFMPQKSYGHQKNFQKIKSSLQTIPYSKYIFRSMSASPHPAAHDTRADLSFWERRYPSSFKRTRVPLLYGSITILTSVLLSPGSHSKLKTEDGYAFTIFPPSFIMLPSGRSHLNLTSPVPSGFISKNVPVVNHASQPAAEVSVSYTLLCEALI